MSKAIDLSDNSMGWKVLSPEGKEMALTDVSTVSSVNGVPTFEIKGIIKERLKIEGASVPASNPSPDLAEQTICMSGIAHTYNPLVMGSGVFQTDTLIPISKNKSIKSSKSSPNLRTEKFKQEQARTQQTVFRHMLFAILFALVCHYCYVNQPLDKLTFWMVDKYHEKYTFKKNPIKYFGIIQHQTSPLIMEGTNLVNSATNYNNITTNYYNASGWGTNSQLVYTTFVGFNAGYYTATNIVNSAKENISN